MRRFGSSSLQHLEACSPSGAPSHRWYNVVKRGKDQPAQSLYDLLGLSKDKTRIFERTRRELRLAFLREARQLSPKTCIADAKTQHVELPYCDHAATTFGDHTDVFRNSTATAKPGRVSAAAASASKARAPLQPEPGAAVTFLLKVSLDEALHGCSKAVQYERRVSCGRCKGNGRSSQRAKRCPQCFGRGATVLPSASYTVERPCAHCQGEGLMPVPRCSSCSGQGVSTQQTTVTVDVRPGATHMASWRVKGKGHDGALQGPAGDLVVSLVVDEHRVFHRSGNDLHIACPIPLSVAILGGVVTVPTLKGQRQLRVPPNTDTGAILSLDGYGATFVAAGLQAAGNLRVHTVVVVPKADGLSGRQKGALHRFAPPGDVGDETPQSLKIRFATWLRPEPENEPGRDAFDV